MKHTDAARSHLESAAELLADQALDLLREARRCKDEEQRSALMAAEKRITRARRAVEKANYLLDERGFRSIDNDDD